MLLTLKIKLKLSKEQIEVLEKTSDNARLLYNKLLEEKIKYYEETKKYLSYYTQQKELKDITSEFLTFDSKKEILRTLDNNYKSFFELIKTNKDKNPKTPKFRGYKYFFTLSFVQDFIIKDNKIVISLPNRKRLILNLEYNLPIINCSCNRHKNESSDIKQLKIFKKDSNYYASIIYEKREQKSTNILENIISIDLGKKNLVSYYNFLQNIGVVYNSKYLTKNQKFLDKRVDELKSIRDKKVKYSRKWKRINKKVKNVNRKKKTQTNLTLQKLSKDLSNLNTDVLIGELTNLKQNIVSENKHKLNRQMQNNWNLSTFIRLLTYKVWLKGNAVIKVNEAWTSKTCCKCGTIDYSQTLADRQYICECGNNINRDINGAINILKQHLGDYNLPLDFDTLSISERFSWCDIRKMNRNDKFYKQL